MSTHNKEFAIKMRRIRAEQEREFLRYYNRSLAEVLKDEWNAIFGHCGAVHQFFFRWRQRMLIARGEYIRRNHPERKIFVRTVGWNRKWSHIEHQHIVNTAFGVYEFVEFESKTNK